MDAQEFASRYDDIIRHPMMRTLYGTTGYFNVGYWVGGIDELGAACDRLVDEVAAAIPADARVIFDIGCGLGAGSRRLAQLFPAARVVACNISAWQLTEAKRRGLEVVELDATDMPFEDGSADAVTAMESAQHFDTRADFLREAWRVLRPGGVISLADMLFADRQPIGSWMLPRGNATADPAAYADLLREAGFTDVVVRDSTDLTWRPHCDAMRASAPDQAGNIDGFERSLAYYVFASARKG